jgi:hypothetical protein
MQSVPITTKVAHSNPVHGEVYYIQHYVIKFVSDLRQVSGFFQLQYNHDHSWLQGRQENFWAPGQKETWPPSSNSPNNDTQTRCVISKEESVQQK